MGQYGIHINEQWRVCFDWIEASHADVEKVGYH